MLPKVEGDFAACRALIMRRHEDRRLVLRHYFFAAAALLTAAPAVAQPSEPADEEIVRSIPSPEALEETGVVIDRALGAILDVNVGGVAEAIDPERARDPHAREETLGDIARRDDPYFEERLRGSIGAVTANMGDMMARIAVLTPVLRRSLEDFERKVADATRDLPDYGD